jgi:ribosomal protein S18 acetylase RimI-like enzyme
MTEVPDLEIRPATTADAPALARVHVDAWQVAYRGLVPDIMLQAFTYEYREERFRRSLAAGAEETHVVELEGEVVGLLTIGIARGPDLERQCTGEIWGIYISPRYWRRGFGSRLVAVAQQMLQQRGYENVVLWVLASNSRARRFYEAMGFAPDGHSKEIDLGKSLQAVRYAKRLGG